MPQSKNCSAQDIEASLAKHNASKQNCSAQDTDASLLSTMPQSYKKNLRSMWAVIH
jgi:hypothetical protein